MYDDQPLQTWQSDSYAQARRNFLTACSQADIAVTSYNNALPGPEGEELATDVAFFGPRDASKLLVMVSGVHGVEGFSGSATQVGWIAQQRYRALPPDTAVLMIHLINPWGVAHLRRYTEENVDLCRNFMDFSGMLPANQAYDAIHGELEIGETLGDCGQHSGLYLGKQVAEHGLEYVVDLFMAGQYDHPQGFGFGGTEPSWANRTLRKILNTHNDCARDVCFVEFHTGLGPWGYGQLITLHAGDELDRVRTYFGPWVFNPSADKAPGEEGYRVVHGHTSVGYKSCFAQARVTAVTLEFGTYPPAETLALLLQEHLLVQQATKASTRQMDTIKRQLLEYHHPSDWEWRVAFWARSLQVIRQAFALLES